MVIRIVPPVGQGGHSLGKAPAVGQAVARPVGVAQGGGGSSGGGGGGYDGGYSGGYSGGGGGGYGGFDMPAPVVTAPSEEDYLSGDSAYQTQLAALKGALERYVSDSTLQRTNYQTDYGKSLRDLGYTEGQAGGKGQWNWEDKTTASGKAYQNQLNDFAARGMLQSQGYADSYNDLQRMLDQQYGQMNTNKNNFNTDLDRQLANYKAENTSNSQAARAEAIARRAAQYGL